MDPTPAAIRNALEILTATPGIIASFSIGFSDSQLNFKPDRKSWSANDNLAHLRACADVWGNCIVAIIEQDHPTLPDIHPRTWLKKTDYLDQDFYQSLSAFTFQRDELLKRLNELQDEGWIRAATIVNPPKSRQQTVFHFVRRMAKHENQHWLQIESLLKNL